MLSASTKEEARKAKKLIVSTLYIDATRDVTVSNERVEAASEAQKASNSVLPAIISCNSGQSSEEMVNLVDQDERTPKEKGQTYQL